MLPFGGEYRREAGNLVELGEGNYKEPSGGEVTRDQAFVKEKLKGYKSAIQRTKGALKILVTIAQLSDTRSRQPNATTIRGIYKVSTP